MKSDQLKIQYHSFLYNLKIEFSKKNRENYLKKVFEQANKGTQIKI